MKMTEIEKTKIQVLIKVEYNLSDLKFSDLNSDDFSPRLECYISDAKNDSLHIKINPK